MRYLKYKGFLTKFIALLFGLSLFSSVSARALDLESAILEALKSNPELEAYYKQYLASQKVMIQVRALPEPKLTYTRFLSHVQTRTGPQERILQLNQPFPWPGKLALRGGIANREAEVAFHQYENLQRVVIRRLADSFFDYALLCESIDLTEENVSYIEQLLPVVEERVRGGGRLADTLLLEIEKEKTADEVDRFRDQRPILSSRLETEMGRKPDLKSLLPFPRLSKTSVTLPAVETLEKRLCGHPRVAAVESKVLSLKLKEELAAKSSLPDLSLGASIIDIGAGGDTAFGVVFGVNIPIRTHKYHAEREQATLEKAASKKLKVNVLNNLHTELHREYQLVKDALRRAALFRDKLIPKAEQTLAQLEGSYRGGKTGIDEIVDAEKTLLQLRLECIRASIEAKKRAVYIRILTEPVKKSGLQAIPVK